MSDPLIGLAREVRKQTALLANIRSHVRIMAWCIVIWFVFLIPFQFVACNFVIHYVESGQSEDVASPPPQAVEPRLPLRTPARGR